MNVLHPIFGLLLLLATAACNPFDLLTSGGFGDTRSPTGSSRVSGRALTADGAVVSDVRVFLIKEHQAVVSTTTSSDGSFTLAADVVGPAGVLVNDGHGKGALKQFALYQGHNDAGDLFMQPLESIAPVVDLHGVGFEERATRDRGNYRWPVFNSDVSAAYAARKLGGEDNYEIVKIDLPAGTETVLIADEDLYTNGASFELLGDRVLLYGAYRPCSIDGQQYSCESDVLFDVVTSQELLVMPWWELMSQPFAAGGQVYFFRGVERQQNGSTIFGPMYEYHVRPARLDPETGDLVMGAMPDFGWVSQLASFVHSDGRMAFVPTRYCDPASGPECTFNPAQSLYVTELDWLTTRYLTTLTASPTWFSESRWDGSALFFAAPYDYQTATQKIQRVGIDSGAVSTLRTLDCLTDGCIGYGAGLVAPDQSALLVLLARYQENQPTTERGYFRVDPQSSALDALPMVQSIDGVSFTLCGGDYPYCQATIGAGGGVEITQVVLPADGQRFGAIVEFPAGGGSQGRLFAIGEADSVPTVVRPPDNSSEAVLLRDLESGFLQIAVGNAGATPVDLLQLTFITADHHDLVYAPAGDFLYYFTRDPISGYEQLFRIASRGLADTPM